MPRPTSSKELVLRQLLSAMYDQRLAGPGDQGQLGPKLNLPPHARGNGVGRARNPVPRGRPFVPSMGQLPPQFMPPGLLHGSSGIPLARGGAATPFPFGGPMPPEDPTLTFMPPTGSTGAGPLGPRQLPRGRARGLARRMHGVM